MKFIEQKISGVFLIEPEPFIDERGLLRRHFCQREFDKNGIISRVAQCNVSENKLKYTLRGFHYQLPPYEEGKTLSCLKGALYDIVVDLRTGSPTFLKWVSLELTDDNRKSLHVPPGCANAYLTLEDNTWIYYHHSEFYTPGAENGFRYNDPFFNFEWPVEPSIISDKDRNFPDFTLEKNVDKQ